jgi:hypothetical protein
VWFVDSGASRHMTGMRSVFLSLSKIDLDCVVDSGADSQLAVKGVGSVRFQLESGGFLDVAGVLYIPEMTINLLSVSSLEVDGFGVAFYCGRVFLYSEGATLDTIMLLGDRYCYRTSCRLGKARPNHQVATTLGHYTQCHLDIGPALQG